MHHRHNGLLFKALENGVAVDDVRYWKPGRPGMVHTGRHGASKLYGMMSHLADVIDEYMDERADI